MPKYSPECCYKKNDLNSISCSLKKDNVIEFKWASNMKIYHSPQITITGNLTKCFPKLWASEIDPFSPFIWSGCLDVRSILQMHNWIKKKPQKQKHKTDCRIKWRDRKEEEEEEKRTPEFMQSPRQWYRRTNYNTNTVIMNK